MTDVVPANGATNLPATVDEDVVPGLEDFDPQELRIPAVRLNGKNATFVDTLTDIEMPEIEVVILGLNRQRVLWAPEMSPESKGPLCRSLEGATGTPDLDNFPWKAAKLTPRLFITTEEDPDSGVPVKTLTNKIPCAECNLKEWETNPKGTGTPWCNEQYVFGILLKRETEDGEELWTPGILPISRSGIKNANKYMMVYKMSQAPPFVDFTRLTLKQMTRGSVDYAVPEFHRLGKTDKADRAFYTQSHYQIRNFLQTPWGRSQVQDDGPVPTVQAARSGAVAGEDEEPF